MMDSLCAVCLCCDQELTPITKTSVYNFYKDLIKRIPETQKSLSVVKICWICCAILHKFHCFERQVHRCYTKLAKLVAKGQHSVETIAKSSSFQSRLPVNISIPQKEKEKPEILNNNIDALKAKMSLRSNNKQLQNLAPDTVEEKKAVKLKEHKNEDSEEQEYNSDYDAEYLDIDSDVSDQNEDNSNREKIEAKTSVCSNKTKKVHKRSKSTDTTERPKCLQCKKVYISMKTYRSHQKLVHGSKETCHECSHCGRLYHWEANLKRHLRVAHKIIQKEEYYCSECDRQFATEKTYNHHMTSTQIHVPKSEFNYTCDHCGEKFITKYILIDHIDWVHMKRIKYRCKICCKPFKNYNGLCTHMKVVHKGLKNRNKHYLCHLCGQAYDSPSTLECHVKAKHRGETHACAECGARFRYTSGLGKHVRRKHNNQDETTGHIDSQEFYIVPLLTE